MKPVIPDYEWITYGERVKKPVIPDYEWITYGERVIMKTLLTSRCINQRGAVHCRNDHLEGLKLWPLAGIKLVSEFNLISCQRLGHRSKKASEEHVKIPKFLERQFAVTEPNQLWYGDVTYIWAGKRWAY